jgi:predicted HD superfamily hydrolase involved in NAD metabolism
MAVQNVYGDENYKRMKKLLKERVSAKRYEHSKHVAKTAEELALIYGVDEGKARMAGLLHDWDKGLTLEEQRARVDQFGLDIDPIIITDMPYLLHGPTAAAALGSEFPELDRDVLQAISRHTSGARNMTPLDMIVYTADLIEPGRDYKRVKAIRKAVGKVSLQELYFLAFKNIYEFLIGQNRMMHPRTADVWNHLVYEMQTHMVNRAEAAFEAGSQLEAQPTDWIAAERAMPED